MKYLVALTVFWGCTFFQVKLFVLWFYGFYDRIAV